MIWYFNALTGFPTNEYFFENHILKQLPLKMKGAAQLSPAYQKWTDEYLLMEHGEQMLGVEMSKKEYNDMNFKFMLLKDFVSVYMKADVNAVSGLAEALKYVSEKMYMNLLTYFFNYKDLPDKKIIIKFV